jgi:disulfide oxidoreductase YuzD
MGGGCSYHNTVIAKLPEVIPNSYVISSEGIPGNDKDHWHFSAAGYRELGKRYAKKMLEIEGIDITRKPTTEINELNITQKITNNYIYTLSGCRVENKNMAPGIYIKNRKKYIIRK